MFGMLRSMKINLGRHAIANSKASAPSTAEITGKPRIRSVMPRISRQSVLSSTTKIKLLFSVTRPISKLSQAQGVVADLSLQTNHRVLRTIKHALGAVGVCVDGPPHNAHTLMSRLSAKLRSQKVNRNVVCNKRSL